MLGKKRKSLTIESKQDKFLLKLYEILSKDEYSKIIRWSQNGVYIIISNIDALSKKILPIYFNHQNYSSFVRQLNMYNFHKIRTEQNDQEQYFINESLNKFKTFDEIKNFKRKEKSSQKCLFFKDEDSKIKYTILPNKKEEDIQNKAENLELNENDDKNKDNYEKDKEIKNKLNEIKEKKDEVNEQIQNINNEIEKQSVHLKKIKRLYFLLVSLLMGKNNFPIEKNGDNKINVVNNEINKNNNSNLKLFNFINRYVDYVGHKNIIVFTRTLKRNKLNLIQKNNSLNFQSLSNIVQKGETFSIPNDKFNFDDYLNNLEVISFKSRKSNRFNDSFSFSAEDKNLNSSFSMIGGNNLFNMDFENAIFNPNKNILGDDNTF